MICDEMKEKTKHFNFIFLVRKYYRYWGSIGRFFIIRNKFYCAKAERKRERKLLRFIAPISNQQFHQKFMSNKIRREYKVVESPTDNGFLQHLFVFKTRICKYFNPIFCRKLKLKFNAFKWFKLKIPHFWKFCPIKKVFINLSAWNLLKLTVFVIFLQKKSSKTLTKVK